MSVISFILWCIFLWFGYNLVVKLILPVYKTTRQIRRQFKNMSQQRNPQPAEKQPTPEPEKEKVGEYIDFEEIG